MKYFFARKEEFSKMQHNDFTNIKGLWLITKEADLKRVIQSQDIEKYRRIPKFRVGSIVRLTSTVPRGWDRDLMKHLLNAQVTVRSFDERWLKIEERCEYNLRSSNIVEVIKY